jgi:hypothetical protein
MTSPRSTTIAWPVIAAASGETRNR